MGFVPEDFEVPEQFGHAWGWPPAELTLEQDLIDLGWHQKECQRRSSFDYAAMSPDETRLLGCVYVDPPESAGHDPMAQLGALGPGA